jgi:hypothetical protein
VLNQQHFNVIYPSLTQLPRWALVALAARSGLREPQLITGWSAYYFRPADNEVLLRRLTIFDAVESAAAAARPATERTLCEARAKMLDLSRKGSAPFALGYSSPGLGVPPEGAAAAALASAMIHDVSEAKKAALTSVATSFGIARLGATQNNILRDIEVVSRASEAERWNDESPVPPHAFSVFSRFDTESPIGMKTILDLTTPVTDRLVRHLARHPKYLASIPADAFEQLIAEVFRGFEFAVTLSAQPGDGGVDVVAAHGETKLLIQCKRKGTENRRVAQVQGFGNRTVAEGDDFVFFGDGRISPSAM